VWFKMDISSKDGLPAQQSRAGREDMTFALKAGNGAPPQPSPRITVARARPSTGRLTSPAQERGVLLRGRITRVLASCCIARLVVLATEDARSPIVVHIDSREGTVAEAMSILSTMNGVHCPVVTFCRSEALGPAAIIASHGLRGYRVAAPGCRFSFKITSPKETRQGAVNTQSLLPLLAQILVKNTRRRPEEVMEWLTSGTPFGPQEALRMGVIDAIASEPIFPKMA
jgi:ATP-dependent protease ClpP protease subunit